jgi:acetyl esterase
VTDQPSAGLGWPGALHPQVQAIVDGDPGDVEPADLWALRAAYTAIVDRLGGTPPAVGASDEACAGTVPVRIYTPRPAADGPAGVIVDAHGGGWQMGDLDGFDRVARALCAGSGQHVVSVDYRLVPEHPFPAARDDVVAALDWASGPGATARGWDGARIVVAGDSAGAQLAVVAARKRPGCVCAQVLAYPALDATCSSPTYARLATAPMLTREEMAHLWQDYCGEQDPRHPDLSPLLAGDGHAGAPPTLLVLPSHDVLRGDGEAYAALLRTAGVDVEVRECPGMVHGFLRWAGAVDEAGRSLAAMGAYAAATIARQGGDGSRPDDERLGRT